MSATASPIATDTNASTNAITSPLPLAPLAAQSCTVLSQLIPDGAALIASRVALALLLGAISHSHPISTQTIAHAVRAPRTPSSPPGRSPGHTIAPMIA